MKKHRSLPMAFAEWWDERRQDGQFEVVAPSRTGNWTVFVANLTVTVVLVFGLLWAQNAGALTLGAPTAGTSTGTIAYQGRLADSAGTPLTETLNMSFRLYSGASGGAALWTEQWTGPNGVQVSDGLFNVMLGSLTPIAQSVITGNSTLFLGITVGTDDEMSPRVQLGSVPFAVQALTVPDGSVTSRKMSPVLESVVVAQEVELTGESMTIASTTIEVETPSKVWLMATCDCEFRTAGLMAAGIFVDGAVVSGAIFHGIHPATSAGVPAAIRSSVARSYVFDLEPGMHTISFRAQLVDGLGQGHVFSGHSGFTYLVVAR